MTDAVGTSQTQTADPAFQGADLSVPLIPAAKAAEAKHTLVSEIHAFLKSVEHLGAEALAKIEEFLHLKKAEAVAEAQAAKAPVDAAQAPADNA